MIVRPDLIPSSPSSGDPIAPRLRALRVAAGLTQAQVADAMGVPYQQIQTIERGKFSPSFSTVERYASACGAIVVVDFAPIWSASQCRKLNDYQRRGHMHPFTCGGDRSDDAHTAYARKHRDRDRGLLVATPFGWRCPVCKYTQTWAHGFMFKGAGENPLIGLSGVKTGPSGSPGITP